MLSIEFDFKERSFLASFYTNDFDFGDYTCKKFSFSHKITLSEFAAFSDTHTIGMLVEARVEERARRFFIQNSVPLLRLI